MRYVNANCRFGSENEDSSREKEKLRDLGIEIEDDSTEVEYQWLPISIAVDEIISFNLVDEYSTAIRLGNTQTYVVDLLYGEVLFLTMPWYFRAYHVVTEKIKVWFRGIKVLNR